MNKASTSPSRRGRILLSLAGLLAAGAVAVGSGADFAASSVNTDNAFTSGSLSLSNSKANSAVFNMSNLKPGDSVTGSVTITNSGTLPAAFTLKETATSTFPNADLLTLRITDAKNPKTTVWAGNLGAVGTTELGTLAAGEQREFVFTVTLSKDATNAEQGKTATALYAWGAVQAEGQNYTQP
ncbi:MAG TPA: TasA family protein [Arthrobacter sp.]|nr:TasA family protein [Arthrobacter sp.]